MKDLQLKIFLPVVQQPRLTKPMERFWLFIKQSQCPMTEQSIIDYWHKEVCRTDQRFIDTHYNPDTHEYEPDNWFFRIIEYDEMELRKRALDWFDRWLGKFIRLNLIMELEIMTNKTSK